MKMKIKIKTGEAWKYKTGLKVALSSWVSHKPCLPAGRDRNDRHEEAISTKGLSRKVCN
jgi:hypothetical protein